MMWEHSQVKHSEGSRLSIDTVFHGLDNYLACVVWDMAQAAGKRIFVASDGPHDDGYGAEQPVTVADTFHWRQCR
jgi:hypothetical protein